MSDPPKIGDFWLDARLTAREAGVVYINDPGFPDGAGVAISIDAFEDAWTDADHGMIVAIDDDTTAADAADGGDSTVDAGSAGSVGGVESDDDGVLESIAKFVLLPFDLVLR